MVYKRKHHNGARCSFCHARLDGLPHKCRYCGKVHCYEHLLPENHNCTGMSNKREWGRSSKSSWRSNRHNSRWDRSDYEPRSRSTFRLPRIRISLFFKALVLAAATFFLAYNFNSTLTLVLEAGAWIYFAWVLYKKAFRWANRVSMADDLAFWGLRLLGIAVVFVGVYIAFFGLLAAALTPGSAPTAIPLFVLLAGLVLLGVFIAFRTNRRHHVVGVWRA